MFYVPILTYCLIFFAYFQIFNRSNGCDAADLAFLFYPVPVINWITSTNKTCLSVRGHVPLFTIGGIRS